jgi:6-phosphogluconolactonase
MFVGGSESQGILYVALNAANQIAALSISGSGALTPLPGSPVAAGRSPEALLGSFNFLDAVNIIDHTISAYSMDQTTGALTEIQGSPYSVGTATAGIINGPAIYVPDLHSSSIFAWNQDTRTGALTASPRSPFPTSVGPVGLTTVVFPILTP